jgi:hypothetical protein
VDTPDGQIVAQHVLEVVEAGASIFIDVIGVGSSAYDQLKMVDAVHVIPINNSEASDSTDASGKLRFTNVRAASYWKLREALDPASGQDIALPPDRDLRIDLCSPRYSVVNGRIKVESKAEIIQRTGRSPDCGDAVVMAWYGASQTHLLPHPNAYSQMKVNWGSRRPDTPRRR